MRSARMPPAARPAGRVLAAAALAATLALWPAAAPPPVAADPGVHTTAPSSPAPPAGIPARPTTHSYDDADIGNARGISAPTLGIIVGAMIGLAAVGIILARHGRSGKHLQ
ncbi:MULTISPECIES: hypothetical protein [Mycobacteriaceae]|uniref:hypothetical protein n=1 Tax=Mycobacteriaceae TaxID=1762 RepID=UPI0010406F2E|nr:hypothetical protein [Mycobacteroides abscessus]